MKIIYFIIAVSLSVLACKKEEPVTEEVEIPVQLLGDTDAELLGSQFWNSYQVEINGLIQAGAATTHGFSIGRVENVSRSPIHSFMIARTTLDPTYYALYSQRYPRQIPFGDDLKLMVYVKGVNLEGNGIALKVWGEDEKLDTVQQSTLPIAVRTNGTFDWTLYTLTMPAVQTSVKSLYVHLIYLQNTTGNVYFDDITLTRE
jgi:hypothetical protein